jgi:O-acetyl-ADP-ribose deacetylase (regulator of RNase III)
MSLFYSLFKFKIMHKKTLFFVVGIILSVLLNACDRCSHKGENHNNTKSDKDAKPFSWEGIDSKNIFRANAWIGKTDEWLAKLGIDKSKQETVVVNAANPHITSPGGGIDGALGKWAAANGTTPWRNPAPTLPDGSLAPSSLSAGQFAFFPVSFGDIYLAVGPQASQIETLEKTTALLTDLCFNMLRQAQKDGRKCIVLCAISTAIFAGAGTESATSKPFTKEEFLKSMYKGLVDGVKRFQSENPNHTLKIILNNWGRINEKGDNDGIGEKVVAELQELR